MYRRVISGKALQQGSEYGPREASTWTATDGDETEDLFELLSEVKVRFIPACASCRFEQFISQRQYPGVSGVSVGAILSNYQRVRVEHV